MLSTYDFIIRLFRLVDDVDIVKLDEAQFSLQHHKAFILHNYLHYDPWNLDHVYYVTKNWSVMLAKVTTV